jgi:hypothetical protein
MVMRLEPIAAGGVEFTSTLTRGEPREYVGLLARRSVVGEAISACSWCRRFDVDGFVEIEVAVGALGLLEDEGRPITHTLCPDCAGRVREEMLRPTGN